MKFFGLIVCCCVLSLPALAQNHKAKSDAVTFSKSYQHFSVESAYRLQKAYVRNQLSRGAMLFGFKLQLTNSQEQEKYQLNQAVTGILIEAPLKGDNLVLKQVDAKNLRISQGLVFKLDKDISKPIKNLDQLKKTVSQFAPALELPDFNFVDDSYNGLDIIANNAMANKLILGPWQAIGETNLDGVAMSLSCHQTVIASRDNSRILEGQWQTLLWMANHLIERGYLLRKGEILFTGAVLPMQKVAMCDYLATFSGLSEVSFSIR